MAKKNTQQKPLCELANCRRVSCGKKILIADYGPRGKWMAEVCQEHYESAHPSRKNPAESITFIATP